MAAYSESADIVSVVAATTFAASDLYKFVVIDGNGNCILPNTTGNVLPFGVLYGRTTTTSTGAQAVPVAISGIVKVQMAASTEAAGGFIGSSTVGLGIAPSSDAYVAGQIVSGSSGSAGRIHTVKLLSGPLDTP